LQITYLLKIESSIFEIENTKSCNGEEIEGFEVRVFSEEEAATVKTVQRNMQ
jgi:hypothetical protein